MEYKGNLEHWITKAHESRIFFDRARKKILYTRLTTLCLSVWNSSAQLTYTRAVLYIENDDFIRQIIKFFIIEAATAVNNHNRL